MPPFVMQYQTMEGPGKPSSRETSTHSRMPAKPVTSHRLLLRLNSPVRYSQPRDKRDAAMVIMEEITFRVPRSFAAKIRYRINTNASPMMQSKAYGIALEKKVAGRWKLPENARVVAAGNELEDSLVANEMAEPLYDRFAHVNIETTAQNWLKWAVMPENTGERLDYTKQSEPRQKIHPAIYAYISYKGDEVLRTPYNRINPEPHADPRRWKMASDMLYATNNPNTLRSIIGKTLARDFAYFCLERVKSEGYNR